MTKGTKTPSDSILHPFLLGSTECGRDVNDVRIGKRVELWVELFQLPLDFQELERRAMDENAVIPKAQTLASWMELPFQTVHFCDSGALIYLAKMVPWPMLVKKDPWLATQKPALFVEEFGNHALVGVAWESINDPEPIKHRSQSAWSLIETIFVLAIVWLLVGLLFSIWSLNRS